MARVTDANLLFSGSEPKFDVELTPSQLGVTLSWYAQNRDRGDAFKYACDFFKKQYKIDASSVLKNKIATFGFVCRIISNGGSLPLSNQIWFQKEVDEIKEKISNTQIIDVVEVKTNVINIQERIRDKANECIGELEGCIDEIILGQFKSNTAPYGVMHTLNIKDAQTKYIVEWAKNKRIELDEALNDAQDQLKEGYSNFTKPQLKKLITYCDQVIIDCQKISGESTKSRKPRKRKAKSPEQLIAKMNYMVEFEELKLKSIKPSEIIGAMQLWVYNTKTRKLGVYHAEDGGGLTVKGSSVINFTESKSVQKKLRKPEVTLPEVLNGGKVTMRNLLDSVKAVESSLTGRINSDTILVRTLK